MDKKKKRRGSQVFHFEQPEEVLAENEVIRDLYQNKNFVPPEPKDLETIVEEGWDKEEHRARRGACNVSHDGGLIIGKGKEKRTIEGYKYWKQEDKERNRRRKVMLTKQWRGRKRPKMIVLDEEAERNLHLLIERKEESDAEEECIEDRLGGVDIAKSGTRCVWGRRREGSCSSVEESGCVWNNVNDEGPRNVNTSECLPKLTPGKVKGKPKKVKQSKGSPEISGVKSVENNVTVKSKRRGKTAKKQSVVNPIKKKEVVDAAVSEVTHMVGKLTTNEPEEQFEVRSPNEEETPNIDISVGSTSEISMATLCSMIPAGELAELLETTDLLFCGTKEVNTEETRGKKVKDSGAATNRRSVRRSARLQNTPSMVGTVGSVFTEEVMGRESSLSEHVFSTNEIIPVKPISPATPDLDPPREEILIVDDPSSTIPENETREGSLECVVSSNSLTKEGTTQVSSTSTTASQITFVSKSVTTLKIPSVGHLTATPPPLSANSKENFFTNNVPRIKVSKKGKTKRRVEDSRGGFVPPISPESVLKDLSNLSLGGKSTDIKVQKTKEIKKRTKTKNEPNNNGRKKSSVPTPDTSDGGFRYFGNIEEEKNIGKGRRESLRSASRRKGINYCEESEKSSSVSRRSSTDLSKNTSLEGSRKNSTLVVSGGEREIDISMPDIMRRSVTGEFVPKLKSAAKEFLEVAKDIKPVSSVGEAFWSDSDEEEIISGIFGKKTLAPRKHKLKLEINRGFLVPGATK